MVDSLRFNRALEVSRPRGAHRIEAFSPKLGRRLTLFSHAAFRLWLCIESDPSIQAFCERPGFAQVGEKRRLVDFWVRYADRREEVIVRMELPDDSDDGQGGASTQDCIDSELKIRMMSAAELAAAHIWTSNWERMLPCIVSTRRLCSHKLLGEIVRFVSEPKQLSTIEREFSAGDLSLARGAVFTLLHAGRLGAPQLRTEALSWLTAFVPTKGAC
jgi:hypothetical protein